MDYLQGKRDSMEDEMENRKAKVAKDREAEEKAEE
jgi:hypothetical protein